MKVYMFYDDHDPPHVHVRHGDHRAKVDLDGNILNGSLDSPARVRLLRYWLELNRDRLVENWARACAEKPLEKIPPLR